MAVLAEVDRHLLIITRARAREYNKKILNMQIYPVMTVFGTLKG